MTDTPNTTLLMPKPSNAFAPIRAYIYSGVDVRAGAGNVFPKTHTLHKGQSVTLWEPKQVASDGSIWIYTEYSKDGLPSGSWINSANLNITFHPPTIEVKKAALTATVEVSAIKPDEPTTNAPSSNGQVGVKNENIAPVPLVASRNGTLPERAAILAQLRIMRGAFDALITLLENEPIKV